MDFLTPLLIGLCVLIPPGVDPARGLPAVASEVFVGTTPCGQLIRPVHQIVAKTDCAIVEWRLTLLRDPISQKPANYRLSGMSRYILPDNNYSQPGVKNESTGQWRILPGMGKHVRAVIYELIPPQPGKSLRFVKLGDNLLHLLDAKDQYMRGDPFQSYTLNRLIQQ